MMHVNTVWDQYNQTLTISLEGRFDYTNVLKFRSIYEERKKALTYIIDLEKVYFIDSSGLGLLLALREHVQEDKTRIILQNPQPDVKRILLMTRFDELFSITSV